METQLIEVQRRTPDGKSSARKVRMTGKIPGVLYGHKQEPVPFTVDPNEIHKRVKASGAGRNTVFKIAGLDRDILALVKDVQIEPVKRNLLHIDFVEIRETDRVVVEVPIELVGKPVGVTAGGVLQAVRRSLAVNCSPLAIPGKIVCDVSHLGLNQALHVNDVKFPEGAKSGYPAGTNYAIATVQPPRAEEEKATVTADAAAEGAEGAAAPAAGAAAPAADDKKADAKKK
jgi:large subunit ribosomal protein L25